MSEAPTGHIVPVLRKVTFVARAALRLLNVVVDGELVIVVPPWPMMFIERSRPYCFGPGPT